MEPAQRSVLYRGAVGRYAQMPAAKPRLRFPWGLLIGLLILILAYYIVSRLVFR